MNPAIISFLIYTILLTAIGIWSYRLMEKVPIAKYEQEFYAAGRGLGGVIIAMITAGGLASAGTFIAGPGMCYEYGYSWLLQNIFPTFMTFLVLAPIGIMIGIVARRVNAVTYLDIFKARYESKAIIVILALLVTLLFLPFMGMQFVGAARVIVQMTGLPYLPALALGSLVVLIYCVLGGMRGTALATLLQGFIITSGCIILFVGTTIYAGGFQKSTETIAKLDMKFLSPTMNGQFPPMFTISMALLTGIFLVGMPQGLLGALSYKNTKALKRGIWMGVILVFIWTVMLGMAGAMGRAIIPNLAVSDEIGPWLAMHVMPKAFGGIVLAGIVAGIQGNVAAMAITIAASIARNLLKEFKPNVSGREMKVASRVTMTACLLIAVGLAMLRPRLIQWIILFSVGGLVTATFGPILLGMHWKRGNKWGAMASIIWGVIIYGLANTVLPGLKLWGTHPSFLAVISSVVVYIVVSLLTPGPSDKVKWTFWGQPNNKIQQGLALSVYRSKMN